jgi:hypothetical protein
MKDMTLRIFGKSYDIVFVDMRDDMLGMCDFAEQKILLSDRQTLQQMADTILHEALHAIDFAISAELAESQIAAISSSLFGFLADNPDYIVLLLNALYKDELELIIDKINNSNMLVGECKNNCANRCKPKPSDDGKKKKEK